MKNISELSQMSIEELKSELLSLRKEQFTLRFKKSSGNLDKTHSISTVRRSVARVKTLMTQKAGNSDVK